MKAFDMIPTAGRAYQTTWEERHYLLRMAVIPLMVKFICFILSDIYAGENIIRLSLIMLPAFLIEGWFLAHWVRTIIVGHRWPFKSTGNEQEDIAKLQVRGRGVMSGMVAFTLINLLMAGYFSFFMSYIPMDMDPEQADPKVAMIGVVMMVTTFFLFRFVWSYVPLAVNYPFKIFVKGITPISVTFTMIALWLVCFIPAMLVMQVMTGVFAQAGGDENTLAVIGYLTSFVQIFIDMVKNVLVTAGMAYAFGTIFKWGGKA